MKRILPYLLFGVMLASCQQKKTQEKKEEPVVVNEINQELYGNWVGTFNVDDAISEDNYDNLIEYSRQINLIIKRITPDSVYAQNIVAGNVRDLKGEMKVVGKKYSFILDEPGTKTSDGRFVFSIENDTIRGTWTAFNPNGLKVSKRVMELTLRPFKYNANLMLSEDIEFVDYTSSKDSLYALEEDSAHVTLSMYRGASEAVLKLNASTQTLKEGDLKNLKKIDLEIIRNTIFARHGFAFTKLALRQFFDYVPWYVPIYTDVTEKLTPLEKKNISLILRFEKYAADNYDVFGR
ncbi:YARHG domain-containing protein [Sphingobacteriaceae bacterium WQ 2009]|uniref:YARHG domain-containing protein n=1 Tax=Rhinopithecimicrobium faecis TaxID=2820698 RepID=A0A8T4HDY0_9SPHI|nr:YARHG domain-containing protein [Sphingobacteriaceae bacterium WQ 2009]